MPEPVAPQPEPTAGTFSLPFSNVPYTNGADTTNIGDPSGPPPEPNPPPQAGRYRALHLLARGGLGEVFVAQDLEIDRTVALKRMQPRFQQNEVPRLRFLREVEVTGQLEHPGIVPVYGLVSDADGVPYYAMRFIHGESLQAALEQYHADEAVQRDPLARRLRLRQLVTRVVAACNAIAFAHSRNVIHRDLKPANIMLGRFGETLVVDWGLAKRVGEPRPCPTGDTDPDFAPDDAAPTTDDSLTRAGTCAGTAAFMSPEQAAGDWDNVGPASDQFSLGATLYSVLTGRAPIEGGNRSKIERAREARFVPPRQIRPTVPRAGRGLRQVDGEIGRRPLPDGRRLRRRPGALPRRRAGGRAARVVARAGPALGAGPPAGRDRGRTVVRQLASALEPLVPSGQPGQPRHQREEPAGRAGRAPGDETQPAVAVGDRAGRPARPQHADPRHGTAAGRGGRRVPLPHLPPERVRQRSRTGAGAARPRLAVADARQRAPVHRRVRQGRAVPPRGRDARRAVPDRQRPRPCGRLPPVRLVAAGPGGSVGRHGPIPQSAGHPARPDLARRAGRRGR